MNPPAELFDVFESIRNAAETREYAQFRMISLAISIPLLFAALIVAWIYRFKALFGKRTKTRSASYSYGFPKGIAVTIVISLIVIVWPLVIAFHYDFDNCVTWELMLGRWGTGACE